MDVNISNHFDFERLNVLLEGFNQATGFVTAILDLEGNVLSKSGWREICTDFHRVNKRTAKKCKKSDTVLANEMSKGEDYHAYRCMNGLIDVAVPIVIKGEHFANLFTGQFFFEEPSMDFFKKHANKYDFDESLYLSAVKKVPVVSEAKVKATMRVLVHIIKMISDLSVDKMEQQELNSLLEISYKEIKSQKQRLTNIIEGADVGTWEWNVQTEETIFNEKWAEMIGYTLEEISPTTIQTWKKFTHPDDLEKSEKMLEKHFNGEIDQYKTEIRMKHKDGHWVWIKDQGKVITWTEDDKPEWVYGTHQNITKRKKAEEQLQYKTFHDELTGLYNRAYFNEEIKRYDNKRQLPLSIIMGDVNGLKIANDTFGHKEGDKLLKSIAQIIENSCRQEDLVARTGGDEFVILLPQTSKKEAEEIYARIKDACQKAEEAPIKPSIALGCATKKEITDDFKIVLKKTEDNMYQNKVHESKSFHNTILDSLETMLRETTNETLEHSQRLENLAVGLGKKLDLSQHELDVLASLANLHDLGKITISKDILEKPGSLTDKEWEEIKRHPEAGYKIASSSHKLDKIAEGIFCHHEHWDGNGYPQGLAGEEIPLLACIISIVYSYDVMTTGRPYKEPMSKKEALEELNRCAGSQFDPELVKIFMDMMKTS